MSGARHGDGRSGAKYRRSARGRARDRQGTAMSGGYRFIREGRSTMDGPLQTTYRDPRWDLTQPAPPVPRAGWYHWRTNTPYPEEWQKTVWHYCQHCARRNVNRELRPDHVEQHLLTEHGCDLDSYIMQFAGYVLDHADTAAQWRTRKELQRVPRAITDPSPKTNRLYPQSCKTTRRKATRAILDARRPAPPLSARGSFGGPPGYAQTCLPCEVCERRGSPAKLFRQQDCGATSSAHIPA